VHHRVAAGPDGERRTDVAIDGDRITEVGAVGERGRREIDAGGRIVTPGFVDIHTHLDAQLFWDPAASSSCYHGVTTVVLGNCGVTFAPVRPGRERYLAGLMDSVEDIPADTIMAGLEWGWQTYGDYLRALGSGGLGVNAGGMVGHSALRYYVMGERSLGAAPATRDDIEAMAAVLANAMDEGALGFSTSRSFLHTVPDGTPLPGTFALPEELAGISDILAKRDRGVAPGRRRACRLLTPAWLRRSRFRRLSTGRASRSATSPCGRSTRHSRRCPSPSPARSGSMTPS